MDLEALPPFPSIKELQKDAFATPRAWDHLPPAIRDRMKAKVEDKKLAAAFETAITPWNDEPENHHRHREQGIKNKRHKWPDRCGFIWSAFEENQLTIAYKRGADIAQLSKMHRRGPNGINSRLKMLNLL